MTKYYIVSKSAIRVRNKESGALLDSFTPESLIIGLKGREINQRTNRQTGRFVYPKTVDLIADFQQAQRLAHHSASAHPNHKNVIFEVDVESRLSGQTLKTIQLINSDGSDAGRISTVEGSLNPRKINFLRAHLDHIDPKYQPVDLSGLNMERLLGAGVSVRGRGASASSAEAEDLVTISAPSTPVRRPLPQLRVVLPEEEVPEPRLMSPPAARGPSEFILVSSPVDSASPTAASSLQNQNAENAEQPGAAAPASEGRESDSPMASSNSTLRRFAKPVGAGILLAGMGYAGVYLGYGSLLAGIALGSAIVLGGATLIYKAGLKLSETVRAYRQREQVPAENAQLAALLSPGVDSSPYQEISPLPRESAPAPGPGLLGRAKNYLPSFPRFPRGQPSVPAETVMLGANEALDQATRSRRASSPRGSL